MKKYTRGMILTACILVCTISVFGCGKEETFDKTEEQLEELETELEESEPELEEVQTDDAQKDEVQTGELPDTASEQDDAQEKDNEALFYEKAEEQGIVREEAEEYWEKLLADNIFQDDTMELTGLVIEDMDGSGQKDLLVMILDREEKPIYGSGCVWIYMNEDESYSFVEEDASYYGWFDSFAEDIDNDGNVEIVLSMQGSGCGAVGDSYKAIFKYKNHSIERMELPSDFEEEDCDRGICISVYQEPERNGYSAYCDYMKGIIYFDAENVFEPKEEAVCVGSNVRGFFDLRPVEYNGKNALQASEYLHGEGGIVHCVAIARFIILWDENGNGYVENWWIEEDVK